MKYWAFLSAKLAAVGGALYLLLVTIRFLYPKPESRFEQIDPFGHDLTYTFTMFVYMLVAAGAVWGVILDQRYRCRTCLRRLRMPVQKGSWTHVLLIGTPRTEYICPYGHGTLKVAELQITGHENPDWQPHDDIWKELFSLEESKK